MQQSFFGHSVLVVSLYWVFVRHQCSDVNGLNWYAVFSKG